MNKQIIKIKIEEFLLFILGLFLFLAFVYIRFIIERLPKELSFIKDGQVNYNMIFICIIWLFASIIVLYINVKLIFNIPFKIRKNIFVKLYSKFSVAVHDAIVILNKWLVVKRFNNPQDVYTDFAYKFLNLISKKPRGYILFWASQIPYILLPILFTFDVYKNFKIIYFYKGFILMIIPFILSIIIYQLKVLYENNDYEFYQFLNIEFKDENTEKEVILISFKNGCTEKEYGPLSYWHGHVTVHSYLALWLQYYKDVTDDYKPKVMIFSYTVYLCNWIYILIKNLFLFM